MRKLPALTLVIGGAASGKSAFAEGLVTASVDSRHYIATGQAFDAEMAAKIERHQTMRAGAGWDTIEEPTAVADVLRRLDSDGAALIDCATLWLTNLMMKEADIDAHTTGLLIALQDIPTSVVIVTNEVGQGVIPDNKLARQFREHQGRLNCKLAAQADLVVQVTVGLPHVLKGSLPETAR